MRRNPPRIVVLSRLRQRSVISLSPPGTTSQKFAYTLPKEAVKKMTRTRQRTGGGLASTLARSVPEGIYWFAGYFYRLSGSAQQAT
jgi:hypothetical protein